MTKGEPIQTTSQDILEDRIEALKQLIPEVFSEGKIEFDKLQEALGNFEEESPERYSFTWAGKRDAIRLLQMPTRATLTPCPEESVNWDTTQNIFIEGDNLEVLKLLLKPYYGRVKLIYIDPPYNTGNDFIYPDNYADPLENYLQLTGQKDAEGNLQTSNPETSGRYHSAWLSMMYPRLLLARQLLSPDGAIIVSIDDHEIFNLRMLMNEVFFEENFIAQITVQTNPKGRVLAEHFAQTHDYLLVYAFSANLADFSIVKTLEEIQEQYQEEDKDGFFRTLELRNTHRQFGKHNRPNLYYPLYVNPKSLEVSIHNKDGWVKVFPDWADGYEGCWTWEQAKADEDGQLLLGREVNGRWKIYRKSYGITKDGKIVSKKLKTIWLDKDFQTTKGQSALDNLIDGRVFQAPKPVELLKTILRLNSGKGDYILDFFAGSGSMAHAVYELNIEESSTRRFITIQLPEKSEGGSQAEKKGYKTIAEIAKARMKLVIESILQNEADQLKHVNIEQDLGFRVYKLSQTNIKPWPGIDKIGGKQLADQMQMFADPLIEGWQAINIIAEVALKEAGFGLVYQVEEKEKIKGHTICKVTDLEKEQHFFICLDEKITLENLRELELSKEDLFICRAISLNDEIAANLALQCRLKTI